MASLVQLFTSVLLISIVNNVILAASNIGLDPEVYMNTSQLITSKGYPFEEYDVHTDDGYILGLHRIPWGRNDKTDKPRPAVLLQHGLLSCSACWVENLVNDSLGFLLADADFDVWLGNSRGNTYSRRHEKLKPDQKEFWHFTRDDMAKYDLPATVNKILNITKATQLFYIGHSQGAGIAFAQLSNDPDLNTKIKLFAPLAPATYISSMVSPIKLLAPFSKELSFMFNLFGTGEFLPKSELITWLASEGCSRGLYPGYLCTNLLFIVCGYDFKYMNETRIPVYVGQHPAGTSVRNVVHFAQAVKDGTFGMFDFGAEENMKKYNQSTPPQYDITKITVPIALYSSTNDWLVSRRDINRLVPQISNLVVNKVIDRWEHLDFIWATNAKQALYNELINLFRLHADML